MNEIKKETMSTEKCIELITDEMNYCKCRYELAEKVITKAIEYFPKIASQDFKEYIEWKLFTMKNKGEIL